MAAEAAIFDTLTFLMFLNWPGRPSQALHWGWVLRYCTECNEPPVQWEPPPHDPPPSAILIFDCVPVFEKQKIKMSKMAAGAAIFDILIFCFSKVFSGLASQAGQAGPASLASPDPSNALSAGGVVGCQVTPP